MKKDILTISRVMRTLKNSGIDIDGMNLEDGISISSILMTIHEKKLTDVILNIILEAGEERNDTVVNDFFVNLHIELTLFNLEIERRKKHVIELGIYEEDTEEELLKKAEEAKDNYPIDIYMTNYLVLCKEGLVPENLTLYESMIFVEDIVSNDVNKATMELIGWIGDTEKTFCEQVKKTIKFANFHSFALDIHNDVDEMYRNVEKKRSKTN